MHQTSQDANPLTRPVAGSSSSSALQSSNPSGSGANIPQPQPAAANGAMPEQQDLRSFTLHQQQLIAAIQQQQQQQINSHPLSGANTPVGGAQTAPAPANALTLGLYQQLLQQQQMAARPPPPPRQHSIGGLPQQFNAALHLQGPSTIAQPQPQHAANQSPAAGELPSAVLQLLAANPALLQAALGQAPNLQAQLMAAQLSSQQGLQQQQLLGLVQMLQGSGLGNLYAYQSLLQQQQQQAQQPSQLALLAQLIAGGGAGAFQSANSSVLSSLVSSLIGGAPQAQQPLSQLDESRALLEQILRQAREPPQQPAASEELLVAAAAAAAAAANGSPSTSGELAYHQQQRQQVDGALHAFAPQQHPPPLQQGASSDRLLTSAESVQDHISRLISENEAIVEPNPVLLKRRPYHRQSTSNSINSQHSEQLGVGSQRGSPGFQIKNPTTRSHSLHEASLLSTLRLGGSLTSGQPMRARFAASALTCNFCQLKFPNEAGLQAHEHRCSRKDQLTKQHSQPQLKNIPTSSQQQQLLYQLQQQQRLTALQQQQQHQSNIAALVGGGMGVAPDVIVNGMGNCGRSSVPVGSGSSGTPHPLNITSPPISEQQASAHRQSLTSLTSLTDVRQPNKKRALETSVSQQQLLPSQQHVIDVVTADEQMDTAESSSSTKIAKMAFDPDLGLIQQILLRQRLQQEHQRLQEGQSSGESTSEPTFRAPQPPAAAPEKEPPATAAPLKSTQCPKPLADAIDAQITYMGAAAASKGMPYFVTLAEGADATTSAALIPYRNRNITTDTFVCLNRPRPMIVEQQQDDVVSMYANWQQAAVNADEERMISLFLSACSTKPRMGVKEFCRYTTAGADSNGLQVTHSSFWEFQNKTRIRASVSELATMLMESDDSASAAATLMDSTGLTLNDLIRQQRREIDNQSQMEHLQRRQTDDAAVEEAKDDQQTARRSISFAMDSADAPPAKRPAPLPTAAQERPKATKLPATMPHHQKVSDALGHAKIRINTEEVDVYVRGRGRGRYACDRCGIRCKKPSMLKKHFKSHTNIRPFSCITCAFSFKTKGNLTKHLLSKSHRRRMVDTKATGGFNAVPFAQGEEQRFRSLSTRAAAASDDDEEGRLVVQEEDDEPAAADTHDGVRQLRPSSLELCDDPSIMKMSLLESKFVNDEFDDYDDDDFADDECDDDSSDGEVEIQQDAVLLCPPAGGASNRLLTYRRFGQENILVERSAHTPPTLWGAACEGDAALQWPRGDCERNCHSAPAVALCSPNVSHSRRQRRGGGASERERQRQRHRSPSLLSDGAGAPAPQQVIANFIPAASATLPPAPPPMFSLSSGLPFIQGVDLGQLSVTQPRLAALIASALVAKSESEALLLREQAAAVLGSVAGYMSVLSPPHSYVVMDGGVVSAAGAASECLAPPPSSSAMEAFLATEKDYICDQCERKFRKESELSLHKQTHLIEKQQNARTRVFQCPECKLTLRSKGLLAKHLETVHHQRAALAQELEDVDIETTDGAPADPNAGASTSSASAPTINNSRNFLCTDCGNGFRTHGVLAKHLRSKSHVKTLISLGKLPDDAAALLKDNASLLGSIDAGDCELARSSLIELLRKARGTAALASAPAAAPDKGAHVSLECREHLGSVSPGPQTTGGAGGAKRAAAADPCTSSASLAIGIKRSASEANSAAAKRKRSEAAEHIRIAYDGAENHPSSPLHSLASVAVAAAATAGGALLMQCPSPLMAPRHARGSLTNKTHIANIWVPPKVEQLELKSVRADRKLTATPDAGGGAQMNTMTRILLEAAAISDSLASNRSAEETSESTGRSESSTPVQRSNALNGAAAVAASPMPPITHCQLCGVNFESPSDLQVHFHADHLVMRDGKDFRCTRKNCDKIYPNRESLRQHIVAHYFHGAGMEEPAVAESPAEVGADSPGGGGRKKPAPHQSPGAPEDTHTGKAGGDAQLSLPCTICGQSFPDAVQLQSHWIVHMPQVARPHVCGVCDAGFTTPEALTAHAAAHAN